jgi:hypothetical protein
MIWLARKAFFGHVPFPVMHVDTGKKFKEMYEFRDRYAEGVEARLQARDLPADRGDRPVAAAGRALGGAQDRGSARCHRQASSRNHRRHPPRRAGDARQGARVQPARRDRKPGISAISRRSSGTSTRPTSRRAPISASTRCCTGPSSTSGAIPSARTSRSSISISRQETASAIARSATRTSPRRSTARHRLDRRSHRRAGDQGRRTSGRAMDHEREDAFERLRARVTCRRCEDERHTTT